MQQNYLIVLGAITLLSGCIIKPDNGNEAVKREDSSATCEAMGYIPGNALYNECVESEKLRRPDMR